jgi:glycosyltransferase involved in cell wall biosynthesis
MSTETGDANDRPTEELLVSLVIPCLNEEAVIGEFVDWCREGLANAGVAGEILIIDSSTDRSSQIATEHGAIVINVPRRGLGRAYIDSLQHIRGRYVIMGDCDLTYDFRNLVPFIKKLNAGYEFVLGSRMKGDIESNAMPPLHRYFGTPLTTFILNTIYGTHFSDIHCGMRAITADALRKMKLHAQSWEYASEMIVKAVRLNLKIGEVPIHFFKDREGRMSHHRRSGWLSPWMAGWTNLRAMFTYAPDLVLGPIGLILFILGFGGSTLLASGPIPTPWLTFNLNSLLFSIALAILGFSLATGGIVVKVYYNFDPAFNERLFKRWSYNRLMCLVVGLVGLGLLPTAYLIVTWIAEGFALTSFNFVNVYGLELIMLGSQIFSFTLMLEALKRIRY